MSITNKPRILEGVKKDILKKNNYICPICGKPVTLKTGNVDHCFPRALYKWTNDRAVYALVENEYNLFITHNSCNTKKKADMPWPNYIQKLHISDERKAILIDFYNLLERKRDEYFEIKKKVIEKQDHKCYICGKHIGLMTSTMRRIDNSKPRCAENAKCVCNRCNNVND